MMNLKQIRSEVDQRRGKRSGLLEDKKAATKDLQKFTILSRRLEEAQTIIRTVTLQTQQELQYHISSITSMALEAVFADPYQFEVEFVERRNKTEADVYFTKNGDKIDPMSGSGGGVVDIAAFSLRASLRQLQSNASRKILILDEPFRFLSKGLQPRAAEMLREISLKLGLQIIMVTHNEDLMKAADKTFYVDQKRGRSIVTSDDDQAVEKPTIQRRRRK